MTVIRCLTMQKNEVDMLEPWILWHGALFGFENLTVVDNGSSHARVRRIQAQYQERGVTIIRSLRGHRDFLNKGDVLADIIRDWDEAGDYDFALPMDCDEFLAVFLDRFSVEPEDIRNEFEALKEEEATLITDHILLNVPEAPGYFRPQSVSRALFRAGTIEGLDRGLHAPLTRYRERCVRTPFVHLHFHNRPDYEDIRRAAREKLANFTGTSPAQMAQMAEKSTYGKQGGYHLLHYFRKTREEFLNEYRDVPDIYAPAVVERLKTLGIDPALLLGTGTQPQLPLHNPQGFLAHRSREQGKRHEYVPFDPFAYAYENPDVADDAYYGKWPLIHFIEGGWAEGRRPNPANIPPLVIEHQN